MWSRVLRVSLVVLAAVQLVLAADGTGGDDKNSENPLASVFVEDVVVQSVLNVRRKTGNRQGRTRSGLETASRQVAPEVIDASTVLKLERPKRQNRRRNPYGQFPQYGGGYGADFPQFQPIRGSASNAQAQAQAFNANSPFGNFGAAASNAGSQGFSIDESGVRGNAGLSGSQSYNLPNGNTLAISYANGFSFGPDGKPTFTQGNSIAYTGADGKPVSGFNPGVRAGEE